VRTKLVAAVLLGLVLLVALAPRPRVARRTIATPSKTELALDRRLPHVSLQPGTLEEWARQLSSLTGANIVVDEAVYLPDVSVGRDTRREIQPLNDISLRRVLDVLLEKCGSPAVPLGYTVDGGEVVRITSRARADTLADLRVYDVRDLIAGEPKILEPDRPYISLQVNTPPGGGVPGGLFGNAAPAPAAAPTRWVDRLTQHLTEMVSPDSWRDNGGSTGEVRELGGLLLVNQSWDNHRRIQELLDGLRKPAAPAPPAIRAASWVWHDQLQRWVDAAHPDPELALLRPMRDARITAESLPEAVEQLRRTTDGVNLWVDGEALGAAGFRLDRTVKVEFATGGVTPAAALDRLIKAFGHPDEPGLAYMLRDVTCVVTTRDAATRAPLTRLYAVADVLPVMEPAAPVVPSRGQPPPSTPVDRLIDTIQNTVDPESWREAGGSAGSAREAAGSLIITQTLQNHAEIARLLAGLRANRAKGVPPADRAGSPAR
jgi:hypothetical protein